MSGVGRSPGLSSGNLYLGRGVKCGETLATKHRDFASPFARLIPTLEAQTMLFARHVGAFNNVPVGYVCVDTGLQFH